MPHSAYMMFLPFPPVEVPAERLQDKTEKRRDLASNNSANCREIGSIFAHMHPLNLHATHTHYIKIFPHFLTGGGLQKR